MTSPRKSLAILFFMLVVLALTGCVDPKQDSSIPWSRPATWEGRIPGMTGN